ncbi:MAG: DUF2851 family protein [Marinilabiliaceae bacterium]|nr:DUF2851 family protein [Marinilabiliaceae bacterium]
MTEELLQYIWKHQLYRPEKLITIQGDAVEVINPGCQNINSGPDFFNAKVKIGGIIWVGNVEVHLRSSDWYRHKHYDDEAYNNVILHVVLDADEIIIKTKNGNEIPSLLLHIHHSLVGEYNLLMKSQPMIACANHLSKMNSIEMTSWLERMIVLRLEDKYNHICNLLEDYDFNWGQVFFIMFSRAMGFGVNNDAFENVAKSIPFNYLLHHSDNLFQLEAVIMGQAGLLNQNIDDFYYNSLKSEYLFLKQKYSLTEPVGIKCRFLRLRPMNFPTIRLSQIACFIKKSGGVFENFIVNQGVDHLIEFLKLESADYWNTHYTFGNVSANSKAKILGLSSVRLLVVNVFVPFLFAYGKHLGRNDLQEKAIDLLQILPAEKNSILTKWEKYSYKKVSSSFESQGIIYLYNNFCIEKKCLSCAVGHKVLSKMVNFI